MSGASNPKSMRQHCVAAIGPAARPHRLLPVLRRAQEAAQVRRMRSADGRFLTTHSASMFQCSSTILHIGSPDPTSEKSKIKSREPKENLPKCTPATARKTFILFGASKSLPLVAKTSNSEDPSGSHLGPFLPNRDFKPAQLATPAHCLLKTSIAGSNPPPSCSGRINSQVLNQTQHRRLARPQQLLQSLLSVLVRADKCRLGRAQRQLFLAQAGLKHPENFDTLDGNFVRSFSNHVCGDVIYPGVKVGDQT